MGHVGPFLQYLGCEVDTAAWRGSVLILSQQGATPTLSLGASADSVRPPIRDLMWSPSVVTDFMIALCELVLCTACCVCDG